MDLSYSVTFKVTKTIKDENSDETNMVALHDIPKEELVNEDEGKQHLITEVEWVINMQRVHAEINKRRVSRFERVKKTFRHVSLCIN